MKIKHLINKYIHYPNLISHTVKKYCWFNLKKVSNLIALKL